MYANHQAAQHKEWEEGMLELFKPNHPQQKGKMMQLHLHLLLTTALLAQKKRDPLFDIKATLDMMHSLPRDTHLALLWTNCMKQNKHTTNK